MAPGPDVVIEEETIYEVDDVEENSQVLEVQAIKVMLDQLTQDKLVQSASTPNVEYVENQYGDDECHIVASNLISTCSQYNPAVGARLASESFPWQFAQLGEKSPGSRVAQQAVGTRPVEGKGWS